MSKSKFKSKSKLAISRQRTANSQQPTANVDAA